jgi:hypothetical protein
MNPLFGQPQPVLMVGLVIDLGIGDIRRSTLQSMLADHHRTLLARLQVFGQQQDAVGEDIGPDVEHHLVPPELRLLEDQSRPRRRRQRGIGHAADDIVPDGLPINLRRLPPALVGRGIGLGPELSAPARGFADEFLREPAHLAELAQPPRGRVGLAGDFETRRPRLLAAGAGHVQECFKRGVRPGQGAFDPSQPVGLVEPVEVGPGAFHLRADFLRGRRRDTAGSSTAALRGLGRGPLDARQIARFHHKAAR